MCECSGMGSAQLSLEVTYVVQDWSGRWSGPGYASSWCRYLSDIVNISADCWTVGSQRLLTTIGPGQLSVDSGGQGSILIPMVPCQLFFASS
jgi:hypothetical protein